MVGGEIVPNSLEILLTELADCNRNTCPAPYQKLVKLRGDVTFPLLSKTLFVSHDALPDFILG